MLVVADDLYWRWRARTTSRAWVPLRWTHVAACTLSPDDASNTDIGKAMLMPPSASTTLANWSKLSETVCWMGIPKSSSTADTSWVSPWNRPASILLAPVLLALGMNRSRGIERSPRRWLTGSTWRIMITSLFTPLTPCEHNP